MRSVPYAHRFQTSVVAEKPPELLFAGLDDHRRLSSHMMRSSAMMAGSAMRFEFDAADGRAVGSEIRMSGSVLGFELHVEEVVTDRVPPRRKTWETTGKPRLLVIGAYRMGFEIEPAGSGSRLTVFIEYDDPTDGAAVLGRLLAPIYARWCTQSMAEVATSTDDDPGAEAA